MRNGLILLGVCWGIGATAAGAVKPPAASQAQPETSEVGMGRRTKNWMSAGIGILDHDVFRPRRDPPGGVTSSTPSDAPAPYSLPLDFEAGWFLSETLIFSPSLLFTPLAQKSFAEDSQTRQLMLSARIGFQQAHSPVQIHFGPGMWFTRITGPGKRIAVNNGSSATYFASPGNAVTTRQSFLTGGATYSMNEVHLDFEAFIPGVLTKRRSLFLMVGIGYDFF